MTVEKIFEKASPLQRVLIVLGALCFITTVAILIIHLGLKTNTMPNKPIKLLSTEQMWLLSAILGFVGGVFFQYKKWWLAGLSGMVANLGITGFGFLYLSWRTNVLSAEIIIVIVIGMLPGIFLYKLLSRLTERKNVAK